MQNQIQLAALNGAISRAAATTHEVCLRYCEANMSSECTFGCIQQTKDQVSLFAQPYYALDYEVNKQIVAELFTCGKKAPTKAEWEECQKRMNKNWRHVTLNQSVQVQHLQA